MQTPSRTISSIFATHTLRRCAAIASILIAAGAGAQFSHEVPKELEGVDVIENLGGMLPLDLEFVDSEGNRVALREFFDDTLPIIITMNYYRCPMLCTMQLNGMVRGLNALDFEPGRDYRILTFTVDPEETPDLAAAKKRMYVGSLNKEGGVEGWTFFVSEDNQVAALAEAVGFGYRWDARRSEWAHPSVIMIASPRGRLTRYLYGVEYRPEDLRLALLEGGQGRIGSTLERLLLWCFHFDDTSGQYTVHIMRLMRVFGGLTVLVLGSGLFVLWHRDRTRQHSGDGGPGNPTQSKGSAGAPERKLGIQH